MEYCYTILGSQETLKMTNSKKDDEIRWQVIKAMLEEFPSLRGKVQKYIKEKTEKANAIQVCTPVSKTKSEN
jgi:hypothetical protein